MTVCYYCKSHIEKPYFNFGDYYFCSPKCMNDWKRYELSKPGVRLSQTNYKLWHEVSNFVFDREERRCEICGSKIDEIIPGSYAFHHKTPLSKGGNNLPDNIQLLCNNCHNLIHYGISNTVRKREIVLEHFRPTSYQYDISPITETDILSGEVRELNGGISFQTVIPVNVRVSSNDWDIIKSRIFNGQNGLCALCKKDISDSSNQKYVYVSNDLVRLTPNLFSNYFSSSNGLILVCPDCYNIVMNGMGCLRK